LEAEYIDLYADVYKASLKALHAPSPQLLAQIEKACHQKFGPELEQAGLLPRRFSIKRLRTLGYAGIIFIALLLLTRLSTALMQGHTNIGFMILLGIFGCFLTKTLALTPTYTQSGIQFLQSMTSHEKDMSITLKVACSGLVVLAATEFAFLHTTFRPQIVTSGLAAGGSCASSCGGGGCGGGCGG
jgi:uncharacterized protein (TIGR04222 family)